MTTFDLEEYEKRCNEFQEIHEELYATYRRLYDTDSYAALSGVYLSMLRSILCTVDDYTYNNNISILRSIVKDNHMEYYKNVCNPKCEKP